MLTKILNFIDVILSFFERWTLLVAIVVSLVALFFNVVLRYTFNYGLGWSEELTRIIIQYIAFVGCAAAMKRRSMIKIDVVTQTLPRLKTPLNYFSDLVTLFFSLYIMYYGWKAVLQMSFTSQVTAILRIPFEYVYFIVPMAGFMMFARTFQNMWQDFNIGRGRVKENG